MKDKYKEMNERMRAVILRLQKMRVNPDFLSPNYVNEVAYDMGIELTSDEVVYISDNFGYNTIGQFPAIMAAQAATSPGVIKAAKATLGILGIAVLGFGIYKFIAYKRKKDLAKKAISDTDVGIAIDIYNAIPAGLKKGEGSLFNPFGFVSDIGSQIALVWKTTDTKRILDLSKRIKDFKRVTVAFNVFYGQDLYNLLGKVLTTIEMDLFKARAGSEGAVTSLTPRVTPGLYVITTSNVFLRKRAENTRQTTYWQYITKIFDKSTIIQSAKIDKYIGRTTGREIYDETGKTNFVEIAGYAYRTYSEILTAIAKYNFKTNAIFYVAKGNIRTLTEAEMLKEFGSINNLYKKTCIVNPDKLSGLPKKKEIIKAQIL